MPNAIKNYLNFYLDPNLLSEDEAKNALEENGVNTEKIEAAFQNYIKKIEARKKLLEAEIKKSQFEKNLGEFKHQLNSDTTKSNEPTNIRSAARKGSESVDEGNDAALLEYLKKKKND